MKLDLLLDIRDVDGRDLYRDDAAYSFLPMQYNLYNRLANMPWNNSQVFLVHQDYHRGCSNIESSTMITIEFTTIIESF